MMRFLLVLIAGIAAGLALLAVVLFYNPLVKSGGLSPLSVSDNEMVRLTYSAVASDSLIYTNDGESQVTPHPGKVLQLWEPTISQSSVIVTELLDSRGQLAGVGVKVSSNSEATDVLNGKLLADTVWHIVLPERGTLFVEQTENYWDYMRDIVVPAYRSSSDSWRGNWFKNLTEGPGALGTAWVHGGSGEFADLRSEAVEALTAKAYSISKGPVSMTGELTIEIPAPVADDLLAEEAPAEEAPVE